MHAPCTSIRPPACTSMSGITTAIRAGPSIDAFMCRNGGRMTAITIVLGIMTATGIATAIAIMAAMPIGRIRRGPIRPETLLRGGGRS